MGPGPSSRDTLPRRLPARLWLATVACLLVVYYLMFSWVHIWADMRPCLAPLRDPLLALIPHDRRWLALTGNRWAVVTLGVGLGGVIIHARGFGDHRPAIRWGIVRGSSAITDQADNVISVWRNVRMERAFDPNGSLGGKPMSSDEKVSLSMQADAMLAIAKQRNGEWEGKIGLWLDRESWQFVENDQGILVDLLCFEGP